MLAWDHNAYYHRLLLRQVPPASRRVLDVGCGAGALAVLLARRVEHVDALDRAPAMIAAARRRAPANMHCLLADALIDPLPSDGYDAVLSLSALHHMSLGVALPRFAAALRPGGILAAVALPRIELPRELPCELTAIAGHRVFGAAFAAARSLDATHDWFRHESMVTRMPMLDASLTTREVRHHARLALPEVRVRRLVFWRYLLLWQKPLSPGSGTS